MKIEKIKAIPKYIVDCIRKKDMQIHKEPDGHVRFYAYLTKNDGELVKVTVAVKTKSQKWYCKQCAVHGIHSKKCYVKDMCYTYMGGYSVGWYEQGLTKQPEWYEDANWDKSNDNIFDPYALIVNKEYLAKFAEYRYAAWELYNCVEILQYLRSYEQYPQVEYLTKLGLQQFVFSNKILEKAAKDKQFCKWLVNHREELKAHRYYVTTIFQAYKKNKPVAEIQVIEEAIKKLQHNEWYKEIREVIGNDKEKFIAYLGRQQARISSYGDYLAACNYLGVDMTVDKNRYPHDFKRWHDIRIDEYHTAIAVADEKKRTKLNEQFEQVAEKYIALEKLANTKNNDYNFVAIIAKSPQDLILEGEQLHHCVGKMNYDQKFIREETLIFFIRNKDNMETPFVTVEYSLQSRKVLQCYGDNDTKPDDTVANYVNKLWLPYANRQIKKLQKVA